MSETNIPTQGRNALVAALEATYRHVEELERILNGQGVVATAGPERGHIERLITAILAYDCPVQATPTVTATVSGFTATPDTTTGPAAVDRPKVSAETLRRLRAVIEVQGFGIVAEERIHVYAAFAEVPRDNLAVSDLDEILAALEAQP